MIELFKQDAFHAQGKRALQEKAAALPPLEREVGLQLDSYDQLLDCSLSRESSTISWCRAKQSGLAHWLENFDEATESIGKALQSLYLNPVRQLQLATKLVDNSTELE